MPTLTFEHVTKSFGPTKVIQEFNAEVRDREFLVLLGPSGCGKSTMLRMIAGLTDVTSGRILFDDKVVNDLEPRQRNIAFVFQSYALYPHMTVRANIAFPLVMDELKWWHRVPIVGGLARRAITKRPEVERKVTEAAEMLELTPLLERRPRDLSGGQRQRVAVARALVREPTVYLLDEPLSNLDAKLRGQMRAEISALHERVNKTFVYVTHDQVEAMTMGTRVIVLESGIIQQYGTPDDIYARPANTFVAQFIGSPSMNLIPLKRAGDGSFDLHGRRFEPPTDEAAVLLGVRPERVSVTGAGGPGIPARVLVVERLGAEIVVGFSFEMGEFTKPVGAKASRGLNYARLADDTGLQYGDVCAIQFEKDDILWYSGETGQLITVETH
jgi:multiple sugar transport system ATP-binding protein